MSHQIMFVSAYLMSVRGFKSSVLTVQEYFRVIWRAIKKLWDDLEIVLLCQSFDYARCHIGRSLCGAIFLRSSKTCRSFEAYGIRVSFLINHPYRLLVLDWFLEILGRIEYFHGWNIQLSLIYSQSLWKNSWGFLAFSKIFGLKQYLNSTSLATEL